MTTLAQHMRWESSCRFHASNAIEGGRGYYTYDAPPYPHDGPLDMRTPRDCPAWVERIEKARRDIEAHKEQFVVKEIAAGLSRESVRAFFKAMRL